MLATGMTRGELARRTGRNLETIRYYEKIGLLPEPRRSDGGYRQYEAAHERRLRFIMRARELGFGIEEIRGLLALVDRRAYTCVEVRDMTLRHLDAVRLKIADLKRLERTLATTVAACVGRKAPECPVIDALTGAGGPCPSSPTGATPPSKPAVPGRTRRSRRKSLQTARAPVSRLPANRMTTRP